jgi:hypothetical protein
MAWMNKETVLAEAERLGIDLTDLTWPQMQKAVIDAKKAEGGDLIEIIEVEQEGSRVKKETDSLSRYRGKTVLISPEIKPTTVQLIKYDEELGNDIEIDDSYKVTSEQLNAVSQDLVTGTYRIKGTKDRKVIAQSTIPKQNSQITFRPDIDLVPVSTFNGRSGYLFTHQRLPNIKALLLESGYYNEYKNQFVEEPNVWYSAGKILCCDINLTHHIFREIERKAVEREAILNRANNGNG